MKKYLLSAGALLGSLAPFGAFAEGAAGDTIKTDLAALTTTMNTSFSHLSEALKDWVTAFIPILLGIVGVFVAIWLIKLAIGAIKSVGRSAT